MTNESGEYDRAMEWADSIDPADLKPSDAYLRAWVTKTTDPLAALRLEVEKLRDEIRAESRRMQERIPDYEEQLAQAAGQMLAYTRVLDLIDKQREGE